MTPTADFLRKKHGDLQGSMLSAYEWELDQALRSCEIALRELHRAVGEYARQTMSASPDMREGLKRADAALLLEKFPNVSERDTLHPSDASLIRE